MVILFEFIRADISQGGMFPGALEKHLDGVDNIVPSLGGQVAKDLLCDVEGSCPLRRRISSG